MKIIVAGGRDFANYRLLEKELDSFLEDKSEEVEIISGCASGADRYGELYAQNRGFSLERFRAHWGLYGKKAGPIRNEKMAQFAAIGGKGVLFAFWDGKSRGINSMIKLARKYNLYVHIIRY